MSLEENTQPEAPKVYGTDAPSLREAAKEIAPHALQAGV